MVSTEMNEVFVEATSLAPRATPRRETAGGRKIPRTNTWAEPSISEAAKRGDSMRDKNV
jgi:hypothetical protein